MAELIPIHTLLTKGRHPQHLVCHDGESFLDWQSFSIRIIHLCAQIALRVEKRWLITNTNPLDFSIALLATLYAGKEAVIPPNTQIGTLARLKPAYDAVIEAIPETSTFPPSTKLVSLPSIDPEHTVINLYTSGSTGEPKLVHKTLAQFEAEIEVLERLWGEQLGDASIVATVPHHHIYGLIFRMLWPLSAGRVFDNVTCAHPDSICERLNLFESAVLVSSPAQLTRLPELISLNTLPRPERIFSSGGALPINTAELFYQQLGTAPTEIFGSTETGGVAWRCQSSNVAWMPLPHVTVTSDHDSALLLTSPFISSNVPYRMEDAIELLPDNHFRLIGRLDRIVKIEEKRLSLPDMEHQLLSHPWVSNAAVLPLTGRRQSIGAVVILNTLGREQLIKQGLRETSQQLRQHLTMCFEPVLLPRYWRFPEQLPFNERGKLTKAALTALFSTSENTKATSHALA
ncbi:MAG TPA: AMP-binding protein [Methylotenera sp.]|nr:AMP-binding protein [Methylotenera sp.]